MSRPCSRCEGYGYIVDVRAELAHATLCGCQQECAICRGSRYVLVREDGYEVAAPCDCLSLIERVQLFNESRVPAGYAAKTTSGFVHNRDEEGLARAKQRFMRFERTVDVDSVVLAGPPGVGKTHLVCALLRYLTLQKGIACRFVDFFELTQQIRATYDAGSKESEASLMEPLVTVPVLAIDDLGKGRGTHYELTIIDRIITRRYNANRVVLATTNYLPESKLGGPTPGYGGRRGDRESLEERLDARLFSRLSEMAELIIMKGEDCRLRARGR